MENNTTIIQWAKAYLSSHGYSLKGSPEEIQKTPYSSVTRLLTSKGTLYLKQTPPSLFLEASIMLLLQEQFYIKAPKVLTQNNVLNCFITQDVGIPLRQLQKDNFQIQLLCQAIKVYSMIQKTVENNVESLLKLGIPDWRLKKLPLLYQQLLAKEDLLIHDGISKSELDILHELTPVVSMMCQYLSKHGIPETLNNCDIHDDNIMIDNTTKELTVLDWGESVITHPFFSLISYISNSATRYSLKETDRNFSALLNTSFEQWIEIEEKTKLIDTMRLAKKLWPIYSALGYYRLIVSCGQSEGSNTLQNYFNTGRNTGRLAGYFKELINTNASLAPLDTSRIVLSDRGRPIRDRE